MFDVLSDSLKDIPKKRKSCPDSTGTLSIDSKSPHILICSVRKNSKTLGKVINFYTDKNLFCKKEKHFTLFRLKPFWKGLSQNPSPHFIKCQDFIRLSQVKTKGQESPSQRRQVKMHASCYPAWSKRDLASFSLPLVVLLFACLGVTSLLLHTECWLEELSLEDEEGIPPARPV